MWGASTPAPAGYNEVLLFDGKSMPAGMGQASDPVLFQSGAQWTMYFTTIGWAQTCVAPQAYGFVVQQTGATLPSGAGVGSSQWNVIGDGQGGYLQAVPRGGAGAWDQDAVEAPNVVTGYDPVKGKTVTRLYYTGWRRMATGKDARGCPVYGYSDWKIGMAEWDAGCGCWAKRPDAVVQGANSFEQSYYMDDQGRVTSYSVLGDQAVIYLPGANGGPGLWHMYYQATSNWPELRIVTVHATSVDGVNWPAANRAVLNTRPPAGSTILPGGPYHVDVALIRNRLYFTGWVPGDSTHKQGLWVVSSSTPDGNKAGDFSDWRPLLYDTNGTWWHDPGPSPETHEAGLFAPALVYDGTQLWLYFQGVRRDQDGVWTSVGRAQVSMGILK